MKKQVHVTVQLAFENGVDGDVTDISHAGESLAAMAKSHALDALQVVKRGDRRGVALAQNRQVLELHTSGIKTRAQCEMTRRTED